MARALELARERARLPKRAPVEVWPSDSTPLDAIAGALVGASLNTPALRWLGDLSRTGARLGTQGNWLTRVESGRPLAVLLAQVTVRLVAGAEPEPFARGAGAAWAHGCSHFHRIFILAPPIGW